jgi:DNA-binding NtrC family response regulator
LTATHHNGDIFQEILKRHPGQKAIIASGFAETVRVKEAQRLGAGAYIKKPYVIATLGHAIKEELRS